MLNRRRFLQQLAGAHGGHVAPPRSRSPELRADILIVGGSLGGVAAALAAARMGCSVILTEETGWIGGQATAQGVPLDEHPWIERFGRTRSYAGFREGVRDYYRRCFPLTPPARRDPALNPGAGWASALCFDPRIGQSVLLASLAPFLSSGRLRLLVFHRPIAAESDGDYLRSVLVRDEQSGHERLLVADIFLDATELGDLLELGGIEHVVGAESQAETGEPNALPGAPNPREQNSFTHVFVMDHRPGEDHVIERPRDYDFWRSHLRRDNGKPKLPVPDLFGVAHDHYGQLIKDPTAYRFSPWTMRRLVFRGNFEPASGQDDLTAVIWLQNAYDLGPLCGVPAAEAARHREAARQLSLSLIYWLQTEAPDPETGRTGFPGLRPRGDVFGTPDGLAPFPYIRESRRIRAEFTVLEQHFRRDLDATRAGPEKYPDSVGVSGYRVDIVRVTTSGRSFAHENHGRHWCQQIPLGALIPVRVENVLPACKNLGVTAVMSGAFRVHPTEWNIGEAAGALAAYCRLRGLRPRQVRHDAGALADFQRELVRQGFELDWPQNDFARSYFSQVSTDPNWYFGDTTRRE